MNRLANSSAASYNVFLDSGTYYAEACAPGLTDYSGTDASTVIQDAVDLLTTGGTLFFHEGTYYINTKITLDDYVDIIGTGRTSVLQANATIDNILDYTSSANNRLRHIKLDGDSKVTDCVDFAHGSQTYLGSVVEDVYAYNSTDLAFQIDNTDDITWINCWTNDTCVKAISASATVGLFRIFGGSLAGSTAAIDTGTGASSFYLHEVAFSGPITVRELARVYLKDCYTEGENARNIYGINAPNARVTIDGGFYRTTTTNAQNIDGTGTGLGLVVVRNAQFYADATATYNINVTGDLMIDRSSTYDRGVNATLIYAKEKFYPATHGTEAYEYWRNATYRINADEELALVSFMVPDDYREIVECNVVWVALDAVVDMAFEVSSAWRAHDETANANTDSTTVTRSTTSADFYEDDISAALTGIAVGDIVGVRFQRPSSGNTNAGIVGIKLIYV